MQVGGWNPWVSSVFSWFWRENKVEMILNRPTALIFILSKHCLAYVRMKTRVCTRIHPFGFSCTEYNYSIPVELAKLVNMKVGWTFIGHWSHSIWRFVPIVMILLSKCHFMSNDTHMTRWGRHRPFLWFDSDKTQNITNVALSLRFPTQLASCIWINIQFLMLKSVTTARDAIPILHQILPCVFTQGLVRIYTDCSRVLRIYANSLA